jgi:hypothetical protein
VTSQPIPQHIRYRVDQRDDGLDRVSGLYLGPGRNLHHRQLRSRGGTNAISNLVTVSGSGTTGTHGVLHAKPGLATRYGFMVPTGLDPARVPIRVANPDGPRNWQLLNTGGDTTVLQPDEVVHLMRLYGIWGQEDTWL